MFAALRTAISELDTSEFEQLTPTQSVRALEEIAALQRQLNGFVADLAKHVEDSGAYMLNGDRNAPAMIARTLGVGCGEVRGMVDTARKLEALPVTRDAVRRGELRDPRTGKRELGPPPGRGP